MAVPSERIDLAIKAIVKASCINMELLLGARNNGMLAVDRSIPLRQW